MEAAFSGQRSAGSEKAVSDQQSAGSENQDQKQRHRPFTAEDTHSDPSGRSGQARDTEEVKSSPPMNAEDPGQQVLAEEFVPLPGGAGYRFTRFRLNVEPGVSGPIASLSEIETDAVAESHANQDEVGWHGRSA